jgi:hypothetical protein
MRRLLLLLAAVVVALTGCGGGHVVRGFHTRYGLSAHPPGWGHPAKGEAPAPAPPPTAALPPTAQMFDTITLSTVPANPFALAGYTSGFWPTFVPLLKAWPKAHVVSIAVSARRGGKCLDVEPGDAMPAEAPGWYRKERAAGVKKPCFYSSWWEFTKQLRPALRSAGIGRQDVFEWDADYVYHPRLDVGFDATQWTDHAYGRNLDQSTVTLNFLSVAQPPYVKVKPKPRPKPKTCDKLCTLKHERGRLRRVLTAQYCRVRHPNRHCRGVLHSGANVNRAIRALGGH